MFLPTRWTETPMEGLSLDATGLLALADLTTIAKQTALSGTSGFLDPLTLCPGIHRQQHAVELNGGELPATAALTSGYVFRVENQATVYYLQKVGVSGHLVTVTVEEISNKRNGVKGTLFTLISSISTGNLLYVTPIFMTLAALVFTILMDDWWALAVLLALISARTLNTIVLRRRSVSGWKGVKEPGVKGDLLVLLSQDRWIRLQGQVDALKAVTAGQWLRDMTFVESSLAAIATLLVYINAILTSNATQMGQIIIGVLLVLSAAILAVGNEGKDSLHMHGCIVKAQGEPKKYARRLDLARELIEYTGRDDWAIRLGMINQEAGAGDTIKVEL
ncbi:hypothetical protein BDR22DRAFT_529024 [Usnea florida]